MPEIGKKLNDLKVSDLKDELEKRDLDTVGSKAALIERLQSALKSEGIDPNTYLFQSGLKTNKKIVAKPVGAEEEVAGEDDGVLIKEEPIEYAAEDDENNGDYRHEEDHLIDEVGTVDDECVIIEDDDEYYNNGDEQAADEGEEEVEEEEVEDEENTGDGTNQDNEESINLTIGEEEQKLLHDEAPDDKEKSTADEQAKAVRKESNGKADAEDKSDNSGKDDKKEGKDDDGSKGKTKKDEQSNDKKEDSSEQKSSTKTSHKDDKEKTAAASSNATATNPAGETVKTGSGGKSSTLSRNLWVSGLSSLTRASDLKTIFSKYGKVIGAKVVTNTRTPGTRCYGYVTMSSSSDAGRCIEHLHRTELHGRIISVERTKNEIGGSASNAGNRATNNTNSGSKKRDDDKRKPSSDDKKKADDKKSLTHRGRRDDKTKRDEKDKENHADTKDAAKDKDKDKNVSSTGKQIPHRSTRSIERRSDRNRDHDREREQRQKERERERERIRQREILSYQKIREERERQRLREKERELREEERRRREIRERQRQEEQRLAEERKKLALERERLEKEKAELLRLERERQKLEREKIELERLELKRQQMKIIQSRDDPIKRTVKRSTDDRYTEVPDRKRSSGNESRFEAPPPPRFDAALVTSRSYDKKRDDYNTSSTTKRSIDDYSSSKRSDYSSKRDDYTSSSTKRAAVDDYAPVPPKRSTEEYSKRSSDYISSTGSKRGIDDYTSSSKRDDYSSNKLQRDEYKREVEIRHITGSGTSGGVSSYIHKSSGSRYAEPDVQVRSSVSSFRRVDDRGDGRTTSGGKRYDGTSGYGGGSNGTWTPSTSSHLGHVSASSVPTIKSYVSNGLSSNVHGGSSLWQKSGGTTENNWRSLTSSQDRYDRTYNERSGAYVDSSRPGGMYGSGRTTSDRYGGTVSSRYDGKY